MVGFKVVKRLNILYAFVFHVYQRYRCAPEFFEIFFYKWGPLTRGGADYLLGTGRVANSARVEEE